MGVVDTDHLQKLNPFTRFDVRERFRFNALADAAVSLQFRGSLVRMCVVPHVRRHLVAAKYELESLLVLTAVEEQPACRRITYAIRKDDVQTEARALVPDAVCTGDDAKIVIAGPAAQGEMLARLPEALSDAFGLPAFIFKPLPQGEMPLLSSGKVDLRVPAANQLGGKMLAIRRRASIPASK